MAYLNVRYLAEKGYDVTLIASKYSQAPPGAQLIETIEPSFAPGIEYHAWRMYRNELREFTHIIDHSHFFEAYRAKLERPELRVLKVVHDYTPWRTAPPEGSYDELAGVSRFHAKHLREFYRVNATYLYHGFPVEEWPFKAKKEGYLLFLSRLSKGKGAHVFLDICKRLGVDGVIAGEDDVKRGINPDYRDYIMLEAQKAGLTYLGRVYPEEKWELLKNALALVIPLQPRIYKEVFGIAFIEAMGVGTPVLTIDAGAPKELIKQGETGWVAKDNAELEAKVRALVEGELSFDPHACRRWAMEKFGMGNYKKYLELLGRH